MHATVTIVVALLVGLLPGLALMTALGSVRPFVMVTLAPATSVALAGVVAIIASLLGLRFGAVTLGGATGVLFVLGAARRAVSRRRRRPVARPGRAVSTADGAMLASGAVMVIVGVGFGMWSLLRGFGDLSTVPQEHDMIVHTLLTAYISRTGRAAPWELLPVDVLTGGPVSFYPSGFHLMAGVVADISGDVVSSVNATTVVFTVVVLGTGVAALTVVAGRQLGLSWGAAAVAGGFASLVSAGLYRPVFQLLHDGGVLGNLAALTLVPAVVAGVLMLPRLPLRSAAVVGASTAGAAWIHPSAAVSVVVTVAAWWLGEAVTRSGRTRLRRAVAPLSVAIGVAAVLLVPAVAPALSVAGRTTSFPPDTSAVSFVDAFGRTFTFPYAGYLDPEVSRSQVWAVLLVVIGVAAVVARRRGLGPVVAWGVWSAIVLGEWVSPGVGFDAVVSGFYYSAMQRVASHVSLLAPVLAGLGVVLTAGRLTLLVQRRIPSDGRWAALALAVAAFGAYAAGPAVTYARVNEQTVASRYRTPDFVRVDADDQRAIAWLADHVQRGQRVLNSPNDGSTYLYVEDGIPIVNVSTLGIAMVPYTYRLLARFNTYPADAAVREQLIELNVRWVYVDSDAPTIGSAGSPEGWAGTDGLSLAPGLTNLAGLPGLQPVYRAGSVGVYALDLGVLRAL